MIYQTHGNLSNNVPIYISLKCIIINLTRLVAKQQLVRISYSTVLLPESYFEMHKWHTYCISIIPPFFETLKEQKVQHVN
jgi:hypothetical protein